MTTMISWPSVQSLLVQQAHDDTTLATGTGFVAESAAGPVLITNRHNLTGRRQDNNAPLSKTGGVPNRIRILHNGEHLGVWVWRTEELYADGVARWIEHPGWGAMADVVALPLRDVDGVKLYPYDLTPPESSVVCGPSDTLSVIGFPFGMQAGGSFAVWAIGFIASELEIEYDGLPIFLIDSRSRPGQSGSPVVAYRAPGAPTVTTHGTAIRSEATSQLFGIYSGRIHPESDIGMVWKVEAIRELVAAIRRN